MPLRIVVAAGVGVGVAIVSAVAVAVAVFVGCWQRAINFAWKNFVHLIFSNFNDILMRFENKQNSDPHPYTHTLTPIYPHKYTHTHTQ